MDKQSRYDKWSREELVAELEYRDESLSAKERKVELAAELLAKLGQIHDTPYAKKEWIRSAN